MSFKSAIPLIQLLLLLTSTSLFLLAHDTVPIEFDESQISKLELRIKWKVDADKPSKFVLIMEQKRFMSTEYSSPVLIDDGK